MAYTDTQVNGFTEHGSLVPLAIHEDSQDSLMTDVGGRLYYAKQTLYGVGGENFSGGIYDRALDSLGEVKCGIFDVVFAKRQLWESP